MLKKIIVVLFFTLFLSQCGYTPMYSLDNKSNFNFISIKTRGDDELSKFLKLNLDRYNHRQSDKQISLDIIVDYEKLSQSKDLTGTTTDYLLIAEVNFNILFNGQESEINIKKDFVMKDMDKEFEERNYERTIKQNFAYSIINKLIIQLSKSR